MRKRRRGEFVSVYHGSGRLETEEAGQLVMAAWGASTGGIGESLFDGGNPVGMSSIVHSDGSVTPDGGTNPISDSSLVNADDIHAPLRPP